MTKLDRQGKPKLVPTNSEERVLMTFQVDESLRTAANQKAKQTSINLSQFLRQCVYEFAYSDEIGKALKQVQQSVTRDALSSRTTN